MRSIVGIFAFLIPSLAWAAPPAAKMPSGREHNPPVVLNEVDVVPPDEPLPKLPVARAVWEPKPDLATSAESWITAGGPHHTVLSTAVETEQLVDFANLLGVELLIIDGSTNRRDFADRIRWNQAYYRLAQGF